MKRIFPKFLYVGSIAPSNYRFMVVLNHCSLLGLTVHALLVPIFALLGVLPMAIYNVVSAMLWAAAVLLNRRARHNLALALAYSEVAAHATLSTVYLGWGSGFPLYLLLAPPLMYFNPLLSDMRKHAWVASSLLLFVGLRVYDHAFGPLSALPQVVLSAFDYGNILTIFAVLSGLSYYYHAIATTAEKELRRTNLELKALASTDSLTGLMNRRKMLEELEDEVERFARHRRPFSVILADVDDFKRFNDDFGHETGDYILMHTAWTMGSLVRQVDRLARWGGEEFLLLLPETGLEGAERVAKKIRAYIAEQVFTRGGLSLRITLTMGVAVFHADDHIDRCIARADQALYKGKQLGKNRVMTG